MNNTFKFSARATAAAAVLALGSSAFALTFDANIEIDSIHKSGSALTEAQTGLSQGGRVEFNASGKVGADMFVTGRATLLALQSGAAATDDMWIQVGSAKGAVKLGRFEAADLFPIANDAMVAHAASVYYNNDMRGRSAFATGSPFHAAGTLNLGSGLSLEVGVMQSKGTGDAAGVRPVLSYASGPLNLSVGFESGKYQGSDNNVSGAGATVGYKIGAVKLTGNVSKGKTNSALANNNKSAYALTVATGGFAAGMIAGSTDNVLGGEDKVQTGYVAYTMPLFDLKGATVTPAFSSSTAKNSTLDTNVSLTGFNLRLDYAF